MTRKAIAGARILAGRQWFDDHALLVADGTISAVRPVDALDGDAEVEWLDGGVLLPGFIDTQVNGGGGVLFNDRPDVDGIAAIAQVHRRFGTTALLPTLISDEPAVIARAIAAVDEAILAGVPGVVGIHIEGPFLNAHKRGIHEARRIRPLDAAAVELIASLRHGVTLVTLAPECAAPGLIAELTRRGIIVAAGHSLATYDDMVRAAGEGLRGVTHLFNAMSQLGSREPGLVGAAMDLRLTSGLIVDGHHVHPATLRAAYRAMGADALMLVTDAMSTVGHAADGFRLGETWIRAEDAALRGPDGTLAGSTLDMAQALRNAVTMMDLDLATASRMASGTPAALLGLTDRIGTIAPGRRADLVHLDDALMPLATWIGGQRA